MNNIRRILSSFMCFIICMCVMPNYADAATVNYEKYNFTYYVFAEESSHHRSTRKSDEDFYYFDFDHNIVVYEHHKSYRSISKTTSSYDFKVYKLKHDSNGLMSIIDLYGKESDLHFKLEGLLLKKIIVCDSKGNNISTDKWIENGKTLKSHWFSEKVYKQPPDSLDKTDFYKTYPDPDKLLAKFKD